MNRTFYSYNYLYTSRSTFKDVATGSQPCELVVSSNSTDMSKRKIDASKETEEARSGRRAPYPIWHFTIQASLSGLGMDLESFHGFLHDTFTTMVL